MWRGSCRAGGSAVCRAVLQHLSFTSSSLSPGSLPETLARLRQDATACVIHYQLIIQASDIHYLLYQQPVCDSIQNGYFISANSQGEVCLSTSAKQTFSLYVWQLTVNYAITCLVNKYTPYNVFRKKLHVKMDFEDNIDGFLSPSKLLCQMYSEDALWTH